MDHKFIFMETEQGEEYFNNITEDMDAAAQQAAAIDMDRVILHIAYFAAKNAVGDEKTPKSNHSAPTHSQQLP